MSCILDCKLEERLIMVSGNDCNCLGNTVTYECTIHGEYGGFTLWAGNFFLCSSGGKVIELEHRELLNNNAHGGEAKFCNNGNIAGRIIQVENGSFTSQLNVTLTSDIVGQNIKCAYDNGTVHGVGSLNLTTG